MPWYTSGDQIYNTLAGIESMPYGYGLMRDLFDDELDFDDEIFEQLLELGYDSPISAEEWSFMGSFATDNFIKNHTAKDQNQATERLRKKNGVPNPVTQTFIIGKPEDIAAVLKNKNAIIKAAGGNIKILKFKKGEWTAEEIKVSYDANGKACHAG